MSGQFNPKVNNLRAMFEHNKDSPSPPSRGRSPAGSEIPLDETSRPISKVRTSFVAVEPSGQMEPSIDQRKSNNNGIIEANDARNKSSPVTNGSPSDVPMTNGNPEKYPSTTQNSDDQEHNALDENAAANGVHEPKAPGINNTNPQDKAADTDAEHVKEDNVRQATPAQNTQSDEPEALGPASQPQGLGVILKGAPFEKQAEEKVDTPSKEESSPKDSSVSYQEQTPFSNPKTVKRQSKAGSTVKTVSPKSKALSPRLSKRNRPSTVKAGETTIPKPSKESQISPNGVKRQQPPNQPPKISDSPKLLKDAGAELRKPDSTRSNKPSTAAKGSTAPAKNAAQAVRSPNNKSGNKTSQGSPPMKSRPKSPTRPVRLPACATAPTASSAAKHGDGSVPRSPSRVSGIYKAGPSTSKDRPTRSSRETTTNIGLNTRKVSAKQSLPTSSTTNQKQNQRTSTASSKAPESSFLARMMRPTQSSASKTHEKAEHGSPPSKSRLNKPKRKSDGSESGKPQGLSNRISVPLPNPHEDVPPSHTPPEESKSDAPETTEDEESREEAPSTEPIATQ